MEVLAAVREFCAAIGIAGPRQLPVVLSFERSGRVMVELHEHGVLLSLSRDVSVHRHGVAAAALRAVNPQRGLPFRVRAAFNGEETLVLLSVLDPAQLDVSTLDGIIGLFSRLADEAEAAAG
jgi:type III secretion system chaperone SycN